MLLQSWNSRLVLAATLLAGVGIAQTNPIKVQNATWLGNVTSTNTKWSRDLGFQGQVGSCYVNTFGDDFICALKNPQKNCDFAAITARNSCGKPTSATTYQDYFLKANGSPQQCIPDILFEDPSNPAGITNAVPTGSNTGIIYFLAGNSTVFDPENQYTKFSGAGFALMEASSDCNSLNVMRIFKNVWYGDMGGNALLAPANETYYGDHGALLAQDGLLYIYGSIPGHTNAVGLARVDPTLAGVLTAYEYWNGNAWQLERIFNPTVDIAVMTGLGQGTVFWNAYYKRYIYISSFIGFVFARTAKSPEGPWSANVNIFTVNNMPYRWIPAAGSYEFMYTPTLQPKYSDPNGKYIVFWVTYAVGKAANDDHGGHQVITSVRIDFQ